MPMYRIYVCYACLFVRKYLRLARTIYKIYTVYVRYFWQVNHQIYGHIHCIYTVQANPKNRAVVASWGGRGEVNNGT